MAKKDRQMIHKEAVAQVEEQAKTKTVRSKEPVKPTTNITYIMLRQPHRALREYSFNNDISLQQILDDLVEQFFKDKALGPFKRATGGEK